MVCHLIVAADASQKKKSKKMLEEVQAQESSCASKQSEQSVRVRYPFPCTQPRKSLLGKRWLVEEAEKITTITSIWHTLPNVFTASCQPMKRLAELVFADKGSRAFHHNLCQLITLPGWQRLCNSSCKQCTQRIDMCGSRHITTLRTAHFQYFNGNATLIDSWPRKHVCQQSAKHQHRTFVHSQINSTNQLHEKKGRRTPCYRPFFARPKQCPEMSQLCKTQKNTNIHTKTNQQRKAIEVMMLEIDSTSPLIQLNQDRTLSITQNTVHNCANMQCSADTFVLAQNTSQTHFLTFLWQYISNTLRF